MNIATLETYHLSALKPPLLEALDKMHKILEKDEETSPNVAETIATLRSSLNDRLPFIKAPINADSFLTALELDTKTLDNRERHDVNIAVKAAFTEAAIEVIKDTPSRTTSLIGAHEDTGLGLAQRKGRVI